MGKPFFKKARGEQSAVKMGLYGPSGSGKTFTALLFAEGLAKHTGKRAAFIDTERGTDFYVKDVKARSVHPQAFDIDALYSKSITEVLDAVKSLDPAEHGVLVLDSITHIWEAAKNAYAGKLTRAGTIPLPAWGQIKKPYKELLNLLLSSPIHVIFCGREGNEFETDEESGELKKVGVKMKAEGETPYEPHILLRMESIRSSKDRSMIVAAYAEKDRTGVLAGKVIEWPTFDNVIKPILLLLGDTQAKIESEDETSAKDAERLSEEEKQRITESEKTLGQFQARFKLAKNLEELTVIGVEITPELKKTMTSSDVATLRESFLEAQDKLK
jgi:hypothetical protein